MNPSKNSAHSSAFRVAKPAHVQRLFCWNWKFAELYGNFHKVATGESMSAFHPADRHGKLGEYQNFGTVIGMQHFHILE
jgi:hypothetical protein